MTCRASAPLRLTAEEFSEMERGAQS